MACMLLFIVAVSALEMDDIYNSSVCDTELENIKALENEHLHGRWYTHARMDLWYAREKYDRCEYWEFEEYDFDTSFSTPFDWEYDLRVARRVSDWDDQNNDGPAQDWCWKKEEDVFLSSFCALPPGIFGAELIVVAHDADEGWIVVVGGSPTSESENSDDDDELCLPKNAMNMRMEGGMWIMTRSPDRVEATMAKAKMTLALWGIDEEALFDLNHTKTCDYTPLLHEGKDNLCLLGTGKNYTFLDDVSLPEDFGAFSNGTCWLLGEESYLMYATTDDGNYTELAIAVHIEQLDLSIGAVLRLDFHNGNLTVNGNYTTDPNEIEAMQESSVWIGEKKCVMGMCVGFDMDDAGCEEDDDDDDDDCRLRRMSIGTPVVKLSLEPFSQFGEVEVARVQNGQIVGASGRSYSRSSNAGDLDDGQSSNDDGTGGNGGGGKKGNDELQDVSSEAFLLGAATTILATMF